MNRHFCTGRVSATWLILIAALAAGTGLWFGARMHAVAPPPQLENTVLYPSPRTLPEFQLTRSDGQPFTLDDWKGHWTVVFFGFTNCPDICPTTLATFKQTRALLNERGLQDKVRFDFISVDPERDTPEQLARYVSFVSADIVAATGSDEELTRLTRALGVVYIREKSTDGHYTVDHSAGSVLIDPQGRQVGLIRAPLDAAKLAGDLEKLAGAG